MRAAVPLPEFHLGQLSPGSGRIVGLGAGKRAAGLEPVIRPGLASDSSRPPSRLR